MTSPEECDTGDMVDSPTCDFDCTDPVCGDDHENVMAGEECDDGNTSNNDFCVTGSGGICRDARCGDGFVRTNVEECDDGNSDNTDGCPDGTGGTCEPARCGDGFIRAGVEQCERNSDCDPALACNDCQCS